MKLTAIIIAKNEEKLIGDCIKSVQFADEVLVIDSKSNDKTVQIAKGFGARVEIREFDDYASQRTFGLEKAKGDWILYIDADERVSKELKDELVKVTNEELRVTSNVAYKIPRENYYLGKNKWPTIEYLERLFLKSKLQKWKGKVHEHAVYSGKVGTLKHNLIHYTHRDLSSMIEKTIKWGDVEAEMMFKANHPPMNQLRFLRVIVSKFFNSYITQKGYKLGTVGLIESIYQAYSYFIIYTKLWEKQLKK